MEVAKKRLEGPLLGQGCKQRYTALPTDDPVEDARPKQAGFKEPRSVSLSILNASETRDDSRDEEAVDDEGATSPWRFVQKGWFQLIVALCIISNLVLIILEINDASKRVSLFWPDQVLLGFFVFELFSRIKFFRRRFFKGSAKVVAWNMMELAIVGLGVLDQWVIAFLHPSPQLQLFIGAFRALRVLRVVRILRVIMEAELGWTDSPKFQSFIGAVILFNSMLMGLETDIHWSGWFYIEQTLLTIYVFELSVLLKRYGFFFFSCDHPDIGWNLLDFSIVASSVVDSWVFPLLNILGKCFQDESKHHKKSGGLDLAQAMMLMRMMRLMRILRLVKLVKSMRPLLFLVTGVVAAIQGVFWVLVLTIVTLYAMGIVATRLVGHKMMFPPEYEISDEVIVIFKSVPESMFTLFRIMSGSASDDQIMAIDELMRTLPTVKFAFVFFMVTSSWTLLSILTAVVSENMITETEQQNEGLKLAQFEEERFAQKEALCELFGEIDKSGDGTVDRQELEMLMKDESLAQRAVKLCNMPRRDVLRQLNILMEKQGNSRDGVNMEFFVESLLDGSHAATEQSILRLESQLTGLRRELEKALPLASEPSSPWSPASVGPASAGAAATPREAGAGGDVHQSRGGCSEGLAAPGPVADVAAKQSPAWSGCSAADVVRDCCAEVRQSGAAVLEAVGAVAGELTLMRETLGALEKQHREELQGLMATLTSMGLGSQQQPPQREGRHREDFQGVHSKLDSSASSAAQDASQACVAQAAAPALPLLAQHASAAVAEDPPAGLSPVGAKLVDAAGGKESLEAMERVILESMTLTAELHGEADPPTTLAKATGLGDFSGEVSPVSPKSAKSLPTPRGGAWPPWGANGVGRTATPPRNCSELESGLPSRRPARSLTDIHRPREDVQADRLPELGPDPTEPRSPLSRSRLEQSAAIDASPGPALDLRYASERVVVAKSPDKTP